MWKRVLKKTVTLFSIMMILCGLPHTLVVMGISWLLFGRKVNGGTVKINGVKYGNDLLGQRYIGESHLQEKTVLADTPLVNENGETMVHARAPNKSPAEEEFESTVVGRTAMIQKANPDAETEAIPVGLVTCSGSGLDPHISPTAVEYQVPRTVKEEGMMGDEMQAVVKRYTQGKPLGVLGEETVNVLKVNLTLDGISTES